jgi:hypothetical protein
VYLAKGSFPWRKIPVYNASEIEAILETKQHTPVSELCKGLPPQFGIFLESVRRLGFSEDPDYAGYRRLFRELFLEREFVYDNAYDWVMVRKQLSFTFDKRAVLRPQHLPVRELRSNCLQRGMPLPGSLRCIRASGRDRETKAVAGDAKGTTRTTLPKIAGTGHLTTRVI